MLIENDHVSRETEERLHAYMALLRKWNERINLVSPKIWITCGRGTFWIVYSLYL